MQVLEGQQQGAGARCVDQRRRREVHNIRFRRLHPRAFHQRGDGRRVQCALRRRRLGIVRLRHVEPPLYCTGREGWQHSGGKREGLAKDGLDDRVHTIVALAIQADLAHAAAQQILPHAIDEEGLPGSGIGHHHGASHPLPFGEERELGLDLRHDLCAGFREIARQKGRLNAQGASSVRERQRRGLVCAGVHEDGGCRLDATGRVAPAGEDHALDALQRLDVEPGSRQAHRLQAAVLRRWPGELEFAGRAGAPAGHLTHPIADLALAEDQIHVRIVKIILRPGDEAGANREAFVLHHRACRVRHVRGGGQRLDRIAAVEQLECWPVDKPDADVQAPSNLTADLEYPFREGAIGDEDDLVYVSMDGKDQVSPDVTEVDLGR